MIKSNNEEDLIEKLISLFKYKASYEFYAKKLGIDTERTKQLVKKARKQIKYGKPDTSVESKTRNENFEKGTLESSIDIKFQPSNHEQLAKIHDIDLDKFIIVNYWSKLKPNGHFNSSVFCKRKKPSDYSLEDFSEFLKNYKSNYIPQKKENQVNSKETIDIELSISDYHLAKKYINDKDQNIKERGVLFFNIAEQLINKVSSIYNIDTIVFPISNDFFHSDNYWNTTTKYTPQDVIAEYDEEYEVGFDTLVNTIKLLSSKGKTVIIVLVPGNHDKTKSYYLAHALEIYFKNDETILFDRSSDTLKSVTIGDTFIGYHHGNCKIEELPLLFATSDEHSSDFGESTFREVHTGDKHHYMAKEVRGVRIQQMPSLSGIDRWHKENNYINNLRAALVLLYDKINGKTGEFEVRI